MKSKRTTYFLILCTILIWGYIVYYVVKDMTPNVNVNSHVPYTTPTPAVTFPDSFSLSLNYRDPFLGDIVKPTKQKTRISPPKSSPIKAIKPVAVVNWPNVTHEGTIVNQISSKQVYVIKVGNSEYLAGVGENAGPVLVTSVSNDSIELEYQNETKRIVKKKL